MKTVCKKLLCLMLVAMMLVSAVPFAFADTGDDNVLWVELWVDNAHVASGLQIPCKVGDEVSADAVRAAAEAHWSTEFATYEFVSAEGATITDGVIGVKVHLKTKEVVHTHDYDNGVITTEPTCVAEGVKLFTCECGDSYTEKVAALGHNMVNGVCTRCGKTEKTTFTLTFHYTDANGNNATKTVGGVKSGDVISSFPAIPNVDGLRFSYWKVDGAQFNAGDKWYDEMSTHFYAVYDESNDDNVVNLTVWAHYYVEGEYHHKERLYTQEFTKSEKNTMFTWLYSDVGMNKTRERSAEYGYQWENEVYYDYHDEGAVTEADLKTNADKAVFIKVTSKDEIEASVMLYVHTKKTATVDRVIPMPGYTAGDYVTQAAAKEAVKTKYSGSNLSISDLYTQAEWEDLLDDIDSTGAKSVKVEDNGITKIHVIVKNATSKNTADSSNPKTGDNIMIAVTTMALAAAALVSMVELKKRKMI